MIDLSVYIICRNLHTDPAPSLCLLGTSFVTLVFYTRTFSNPAEAILFALLLLLIVLSISNRNVLRTKKDRARYFSIGVVVGVGIWIRPTFLAFACVPMVWCLLDICLLKWSTDKKIIKLINTSYEILHLVGPWWSSCNLHFSHHRLLLFWIFAEGNICFDSTKLYIV